MKRIWQVWALFSIAVTVVLSAMGWVTHTIIDLEHKNTIAEEQAYFEETIRLALWRMDSAIAPLIIEENNRPYFAYSAFYPASTANPFVTADPGLDDTMIPSPLLNATPTNVHLYVTCIAPTGNNLTSPNVPSGEQWGWSEEIFANGVELAKNTTNLMRFNKQVDQPTLWNSFGTPYQLPDPQNVQLSTLRRQQYTPTVELLNVSESQSDDLLNVWSAENLPNYTYVGDAPAKEQEQSYIDQSFDQELVVQDDVSQNNVEPRKQRNETLAAETVNAPFNYLDINDTVQQQTQFEKPTLKSSWQSKDNQDYRGNTEFQKRASGQSKALSRANSTKGKGYNYRNSLPDEDAAQTSTARHVQESNQSQTSAPIDLHDGQSVQEETDSSTGAEQRGRISQTLQGAWASQSEPTTSSTLTTQRDALPTRATTAIHIPKKKIVPRKMANIQEDIMRPVWVNNLLMLGRRVNIDGTPHLQAAWLDWESIRAELLSEVNDLFPAATLAAVKGPSDMDGARMMASLPVRLIPGLMADPLPTASSPLRVPLSIAWACVIFAALSVALLLLGTVRLSERRGAFVSAVTHELRTPLTTFRMYTELLAEGIITDEEKKTKYLHTLYRESNRLGHLVENVLAYSQLEKGTGARTLETICVGDLLQRVHDPIQTRVNQTDMQLVIEASEPDRETFLATDTSAVEQVLTNLVDNACKYASDAEDNRIHLMAARERQHVVFRVCDHGRGLNRRESKQLFKPFRKSAHAAAQSAPGIGLGLALCRQLARQLGGELYYENRAEAGACFALKLPCTRRA